jgi:hypothetical protein
VIVSEPLLIVGKRGEALLKCVKFMALVRAASILQELCVLGGLLAILAWREHGIVLSSGRSPRLIIL